MKNLIVLTVLAFGGCGAFVSDDDTRTAVAKQGYRNVTITDSYIFFVELHGCGRDDNAAYEMDATNVNGQRVQLIACAGWPFKGVTVRTK